MGVRYKTATDGDWIKPKRRGYKIKCCECGLVHKLNFKIWVDSRGRTIMKFQVFRDERATAASRRKRKVTS